MTATSAEREICEVIATAMPELRDGKPGVYGGLSDMASGGGGDSEIVTVKLLTLRLKVSEAAMDAPVLGEKLNRLYDSMREATDVDMVFDDESVAIGTAMTDTLLTCYDEDILDPPEVDTKQAAKQVRWLTYGEPVKTPFCVAFKMSSPSGVSRVIQQATSDLEQQRSIAAAYAAYAIYSCQQMIPSAAAISEAINS